MNPERDPKLLAEIGQRLCATREALGLTQEQCAGLAGNTRQAWNRWEKGKTLIDVAAAIKLANEYHIPLDWTYRGIPDGLPLHVAQRVLSPAKLFRFNRRPA